MTKNVTVIDESGNFIGTTYPKRARGLIKNGRALSVDDCTIRLSAGAGSSDHKSEGNHMKYIFFNPREWSGDAAKQNIFSVEKTSAERTFINSFDGGLIEVLTLGSWNKNTAAVEVFSRIYPLAPNEEYSFVFWLNGGENDSNDEVCQLRIAFSGYRDGWSSYKLNRNFIRPLLHWQGWELYAIAFQTPEALAGADTVPVVNTQLCFVSNKAPMAVMPAKEPEFYKDWPDSPDEFAGMRPQRHNLVFEDGWPSRSAYGGNQYSTEVLRERVQNRGPQARVVLNRDASGKVSGVNILDGKLAKEFYVMKMGRFGEASWSFQGLMDRYHALCAARSGLSGACEEYRHAFSEDDETGQELADELEEKLEELDSVLDECQELLENVIPEGVQNSFGNAEDELDEAEELCDEIQSQLDSVKPPQA